MASVKHNKHTEFHESIPEITWILLLGISTVVGIWLLAGIVKMLFLL